MWCCDLKAQCLYTRGLHFLAPCNLSEDQSLVITWSNPQFLQCKTTGDLSFRGSISCAIWTCCFSLRYDLYESGRDFFQHGRFLFVFVFVVFLVCFASDSDCAFRCTYSVLPTSGCPDFYFHVYNQPASIALSVRGQLHRIGASEQVADHF